MSSIHEGKPKLTAYIFIYTTALHNSVYAQVQPHELAKYEEFWQCHAYAAGGYDKRSDFVALKEQLERLECRYNCNRIFYLALPPSVFEQVTVNIKDICLSER